MGFAVDDGSDAVSCSPAHPAKGIIVKQSSAESENAAIRLNFVAGFIGLRSFVKIQQVAYVAWILASMPPPANERRTTVV